MPTQPVVPQRTAGARPWRSLPPALVVGAAVAFSVAVLACASEVDRAVPENQEVQEATPEPPESLTDPVAQREDVIRYAEGLPYDTMHYAIDRQRLLLVENGEVVAGPLAAIHPQSGSHRNTEGDLARGRVVARIEVEDRVPYPKLGLAPGVNYVWVDGRVPEGQEGLYRAVVVPTSPRYPPSELRVKYFQNDTLRMAQARWVHVPEDDAGWVTCRLSGCCQIMQ